MSSNPNINLSLDKAVPNLPGWNAMTSETWHNRLTLTDVAFRRVKTGVKRPTTALAVPGSPLDRVRQQQRAIREASRDDRVFDGNDDDFEYDRDFFRERDIVEERMPHVSGPLSPVHTYKKQYDQTNDMTPLQLQQEELQQQRPSTALANFASSSKPQKYTIGNVSDRAAKVDREKIILTFKGYILDKRNWDDDNVLGTPVLEESITRVLTIFYFAFDNTVQIFEKPVRNSGVVGGTFFKRSPLTLTNGSPLRLMDVQPGNIILTLGCEIHITEADNFTRDYFRRYLKIIMPKNEPTPSSNMGNGQATLFALGMGHNVGSDKANYTPSERTEAQEISYRFFHADNKIIKFQCMLDPNFKESDDHEPVGRYIDDSTVYFGPFESPKMFSLTYFYIDKNIELRYLKGSEDKKSYENQPLLLKRSKVPINWREVKKGAAPRSFEVKDFRLGKVIDIYGRRLLFTDCDQETKQIYSDMGIEQVPVKIVKDLPPPIVHPVPAYGDGLLPIGGADETLATVYGQKREVVNLDSFKRNQGKTLRSRINILTKNAILASRKFEMLYFLEDHSILIFEVLIPNAGCMSGTFLKRGRYLNELPNDCDTPRKFKPQDIFLGNIIKVNGIEMQISEMDLMSVRFCEAYPDEFPFFDTFRITSNLMSITVEKQLDLRSYFKSFDQEGNDWLCNDDFIGAMDRCSLTDSLNDQELFTLLRRFQDGDKYHFHEMCDLFSHIYYQHQQFVGTGSKKKESEFQIFLTKVRSRTTQFRRAFRKDLHSKDRHMTMHRLYKVFHKLKQRISKNVVKEICARYALPSGRVKDIARELNKEMAEDVVLRKFEAKIHDFTSDERAAATSSLAGGRSVQTGFLSEFESGISIEESLHISDIAKRRAELATSVLRHGMKMEDLKSLLTKPSDREKVVRTDYKEVVIDFYALCDDIYCVDWL